MIEKIKIKNYKAFKEATIPFKPITIFLGANNAGKSSIIRLILLLQQTATADAESYKSALKLHGRINMGSPENLFYRKDTKKNIEMSFDMKDDNLHAFFSNISKIQNVYNKLLNTKNNLNKTTKKNKDLYSSNFDFYFDVYNSGYSVFFDNNIAMPTDETEKIKKVISFVSNIDKCIKSKKSDSELQIAYTIGYNSRPQCLIIKKFFVKYNGNTLIKVTRLTNCNWAVESDFVELNKEEISDISRFLSDKKSIFFFIGNPQNEPSSLLTKVLLGLTLNCIDNLHTEFDETHINYVQPLRAHPQRYYMLDNINILNAINTLNGNELVEVLKDNQFIRKKVNCWLDHFELSKIDVKKDIEIIHHLILKQNGLDLDISDVGFGVSQLLPIITQSFLSRPHSATIVEQPEIHLHPRLQADLADLFIDVVKKDFKRNSIFFERTVIIESHSEYLLRRLRRRMSECDIITRDNVSISLFHPYIEGKNDGASIENLSIEKKGAFEWPEEYYGAELQKDITEFLENQK